MSALNLTNVTKKPLHNGNKGFKIMHLNIRSLIKNIDQFRIYASNNQYDIMCINETWLDDKISDHEVGIDGYDLLRKDRKRTGGGVAMYIRNSINYKIRQDIMPDYLELITVEIIKPKAKPFLLNTWYRPPDMPMEAFNDYELCLQKMDCENKEIICIGDFNCDYLQPDKNETQRLLYLAKIFQLEQFIEEPTRITKNTRSQIDLVFSNRPEIIVKSGVEHIGISDHSLIYIHRKISIPRKQPKIINTRQYKHYNTEAFKLDLFKILLTRSQECDPNILWEDWKEKFLLVSDMHAPPVIRRVRSEHVPWLTSEIKTKDSVEVIAKSLTEIFNKSIEFGIFPDDFKTACISPIHKGDSKLECSNYRPISIISVVAKVFEKLISSQFIGYLETNHLLSDSQSGFRKKSSTTTSIVRNTNQWYINMDKGLLNGIIFLDLSLRLCKS